MPEIRGAGGGGCFTGDTLVCTPNGQVPIKELQEGSEVISFDDKGITHVAKVLKVHVHENEKVYRYGFWGGEYVDATPNHWVLNQYNAFVAIGSLGFDDCLVDVMGHLRPITSKEDLGMSTVYNLTVEQQHTFIANNIRVHNAGIGQRIAGAGGGGGGKGGGGSTRVPEEDPDSLQSVQFAQVLEILSEGEIDGVEHGVKGVYLDGTPLQSAGGTNNFTGYSITIRNGTQDQEYIPNTPGAETEISVGAAVTKTTSITRQIPDTDVDRVRVTISVPALQNLEDDGDVRGTKVELKIQTQLNGGGFSDNTNVVIEGKTSGGYLRDYIIPMPAPSDFPCDIRIVRITDDSTSTRLQNATNWTSYTEIIDEKFRYPNTAICYLKLDSRQFSSIPARKYLVRGIKVKIPHNASVDTTTHIGRISYSGLFNGSLSQTAFTNDPAWLLYALLTDTRWGAGIPESSLDVFDFYNVSLYCRELVSNGKGGQEPRFSCNMVINTRKEVFSAIQELTSLFRGIAFYGAGSLVLNQDKPTDSRYILGPSNVINGDFSYSGTSLKTRHTCATVAYQDYEQLGEVSYEYVELQDQVAKYGVLNKDIRALGCYSQGQAHRLGKWLLLSEHNLTQTVSFSIAADSGLVLRPGVVIDIADPVRAGTRRSGRISSATTTQITIDAATDLVTTDILNAPVDDKPTLSVMQPNGHVGTSTITAINGKVITVSPGFAEAPQAASVFLIQTSTVKAQQYRVLSVAEADDFTLGVTALEYNPDIYAAVESNIQLTSRSITTLNDAPSAPAGITGTEFLYQEGQTVHVGFDLSWSHDRKNLTDFLVKYRQKSDNYTAVNSSITSLTLKSLKAGVLDVEIVARNFTGVISPVATAQFTLNGKQAPPGNVQNLSIEPITANSARLRWDETVDLDVKVNGRVRIRHSSLTDGSAIWPDSVDLIQAVPGNSTEAIVPLIDGEILVKFVDELGNESASETSVLVNLADTLGRLLVQSRREDQDSTPFSGTKTNCSYDSSLDALKINADGSGNILSSAEYQFASTLDLGAKYSIDLTRRFVTRGLLANDLIDDRTAFINTWTDFDGAIPKDVDAALYMRSTDDDPSGSPTYSAWTPFTSGTFIGRAFQFKAELISRDPAQNILIDELGYLATFQRRQDNSNGTIASGTSTKSVTFGDAFFTGTASLGGANAYLPSVSVLVHNLGSGERVNVSNVCSTGFDVDVLNSSNANVNRNFTYLAVGYGKKHA